MKAIVTTTHKHTRFFLQSEGLATDIPSRAMEFRDAADAQFRANEENSDKSARGWNGFQWRAAYMLHNGAIAE